MYNLPIVLQYTVYIIAAFLFLLWYQFVWQIIKTFCLLLMLCYYKAYLNSYRTFNTSDIATLRMSNYKFHKESLKK